MPQVISSGVLKYTTTFTTADEFTPTNSSRHEVYTSPTMTILLHSVYYCSREHQRAAWSHHMPSCVPCEAPYVYVKPVNPHTKLVVSSKEDGQPSGPEVQAHELDIGMKIQVRFNATGDATYGERTARRRR